MTGSVILVSKRADKASRLIDDPSGNSIWILTTTDKDRDGEVVNPLGGDLEDFMRNPVFVDNHDTDGSVTDVILGKVLRTWNEKVGEGTKWPQPGGEPRDALLGEIQWNTATQKGREAKEMARLGQLNGGSISFLPLGNVSKDHDGGNYYDKWKLLEFTACAVPSNASAIRLKSANAFKLTSINQPPLKVAKILRSWVESVGSGTDHNSIGGPLREARLCDVQFPTEESYRLAKSGQFCGMHVTMIPTKVDKSDDGSHVWEWTLTGAHLKADVPAAVVRKLLKGVDMVVQKTSVLGRDLKPGDKLPNKRTGETKIVASVDTMSDGNNITIHFTDGSSAYDSANQSITVERSKSMMTRKRWINAATKSLWVLKHEGDPAVDPLVDQEIKDYVEQRGLDDVKVEESEPGADSGYAEDKATQTCPHCGAGDIQSVGGVPTCMDCGKPVAKSKSDDPTMTPDGDGFVVEADGEKHKFDSRDEAEGFVKGWKSVKKSDTFKVGDDIAWTMIDGKTMVGKVTFIGYSTYTVKRVDGGQADVKKTEVRRASPADMQAAVNFYRDIGKGVSKETDLQTPDKISTDEINAAMKDGPDEVTDAHELKLKDAMSDCVSAKIAAIAADHPEMAPDQQQAVAYSMCGEKALRKGVHKWLILKVAKSVGKKINKALVSKAFNPGDHVSVHNQFADFRGVITRPSADRGYWYVKDQNGDEEKFPERDMVKVAKSINPKAVQRSATMNIKKLPSLKKKELDDVAEVADKLAKSAKHAKAKPTEADPINPSLAASVAKDFTDPEMNTSADALQMSKGIWDKIDCKFCNYPILPGEKTCPKCGQPRSYSEKKSSPEMENKRKGKKDLIDPQRGWGAGDLQKAAKRLKALTKRVKSHRKTIAGLVTGHLTWSGITGGGTGWSGVKPTESSQVWVNGNNNHEPGKTPETITVGKKLKTVLKDLEEVTGKDIEDMVEESIGKVARKKLKKKEVEALEMAADMLEGDAEAKRKAAEDAMEEVKNKDFYDQSEQDMAMNGAQTQSEEMKRKADEMCEMAAKMRKIAKKRGKSKDIDEVEMTLKAKKDLVDAQRGWGANDLQKGGKKNKAEEEEKRKAAEEEDKQLMQKCIDGLREVRQKTACNGDMLYRTAGV